MFVAWELLEGRYHILFILLSWCGRLKMAINYLSQSGMSGSFSLGLMGSIVLHKKLELATRIPEG